SLNCMLFLLGDCTKACLSVTSAEQAHAPSRVERSRIGLLKDVELPLCCFVVLFQNGPYLGDLFNISVLFPVPGIMRAPDAAAENETSRSANNSLQKGIAPLSISLGSRSTKIEGSCAHVATDSELRRRSRKVGGGHGQRTSASAVTL